MECIYGGMQASHAAVDNTMTSFHYAPEVPFVHSPISSLPRTGESIVHRPQQQGCGCIRAWGIVTTELELR